MSTETASVRCDNYGLKFAGQCAGYFFDSLNEARQHLTDAVGSLGTAFHWAERLQETQVSIESFLLPHDDNGEPIDDEFRARRSAWRRAAAERQRLRRAFKELQDNIRQMAPPAEQPAKGPA